MRRARDVSALEAQLIDERVQDHARLHRDAHEGHEPEPGRHTEVRARQLQREQAAHRNRQQHAENDNERELHVAVEREQDQQDQPDGQRNDERHLRLGC